MGSEMCIRDRSLRCASAERVKAARARAPRSRLRARRPGLRLQRARKMAASSSSSALPPPRVTLSYAPSERRVVLSFPGGRLPASQLLPKGEGGLKLKVKEKGDEIKSLTADTSDGACRWTGKAHATDTQKLLVAEYDRSTGAVRLLPARACLLYTSPSPRDGLLSRMPSSA